MSVRHLIITSALALALAGPAFAQDTHGHGHAETSLAASDNPVAKAFEDANLTMHRDMAIDYTGDADIDFVRSMIPHHKGAIDIAKIQLQHGKDPEMRKLAEDVIKAQEAEIAGMRKWLAARGM
ncbi:uncharacterized protein (DUF305 family) [Pseudorhizobium tarimense]|uniref:Uncharacterized protein (DUF305 family) n=1 Tax=Pseudorhizobium tarimense TaxID=1079109 RepID=A0ABV2H197_9HYPH|nr:DUF305 domain-containing protein [Pseudorhizobium tarimense]MCJ8517634.1 DUF305 domain-containing protein [Pseudorhizobium tarimense]